MIIVNIIFFGARRVGGVLLMRVCKSNDPLGDVLQCTVDNLGDGRAGGAA